MRKTIGNNRKVYASDLLTDRDAGETLPPISRGETDASRISSRLYT